MSRSPTDTKPDRLGAWGFYTIMVVVVLVAWVVLDGRWSRISLPLGAFAATAITGGLVKPAERFQRPVLTKIVVISLMGLFCAGAGFLLYEYA